MGKSKAEKIQVTTQPTKHAKDTKQKFGMITINFQPASGQNQFIVFALFVYLVGRKITLSKHDVKKIKAVQRTVCSFLHAASAS